MTATPPKEKKDPFFASLMLAIAVLLGSTGAFLLLWVGFHFRTRSLDPDYWSWSTILIVIAIAAFAAMLWLGARYQDRDEPASRGPRPAFWFFPVALAFLAFWLAGEAWTTYRHSWEIAGFPTATVLITLLAGWFLWQVGREAMRYVALSVRPRFGENGEWVQLVLFAIMIFGHGLDLPRAAWSWILGGTALTWIGLAAYFYRNRLPPPPTEYRYDVRGPGLPD